jgi:hypothetical protein
MHDGSIVQFTAVPKNYDPTDRTKVSEYLQEHQKDGVVLTGLLFVDETVGDVHEMNKTAAAPLSNMAFEKLCPGAGELARLQEEFR